MQTQGFFGIAYIVSLMAVFMATSGLDDDASVVMPLTRDELQELERAPRTAQQVLLDYCICFSPILAGAVAILEYIYIPNLPGNECTSVYVVFILGLMGLIAAMFVVSFKHRRTFQVLRYKTPFYTFVFLMMLITSVKVV